MSFFDDKQEVINIELTPYGKYLLSKGKFKPYYYDFFDDNIIYDSNYASIEENQNDIQNRILNETPSLKAQSIYSSVDVLPKILDGNNPDKNSINYLSIGNSSPGSEHAPAWNINFISGQISDTERFDENNLKIPQINLYNSTYHIKLLDSTDEAEESYVYIGSLQKENSVLNAFYKEEEIFLDITELNTDNLLENFDIEVYIEKENFNSIPGASQTYWKQLEFSKKPEHIINNILLDKPINTIDIKDLKNDPSYVEHFFNILVDDEIELSPELKKTIKIYDTTPTNGPFGENC